MAWHTGEAADDEAAEAPVEPAAEEVAPEAADPPAPEAVEPEAEEPAAPEVPQPSEGAVLTEAPAEPEAAPAAEPVSSLLHGFCAVSQPVVACCKRPRSQDMLGQNFVVGRAAFISSRTVRGGQQPTSHFSWAAMHPVLVHGRAGCWVERQA